MFMILLLVTFLIALAVSHVLVRLFRQPVARILDRVVSDDLGGAWQRYVAFAVYVVGVSGGVRVNQLERYITALGDADDPIVLNASRWTLEVYRTIIGTAQSVAWMLLVFFGFALIAYVLVRGAELRRGGAAPD